MLRPSIINYSMIIRSYKLPVQPIAAIAYIVSTCHYTSYLKPTSCQAVLEIYRSSAYASPAHIEHIH